MPMIAALEWLANDSSVVTPLKKGVQVDRMLAMQARLGVQRTPLCAGWARIEYNWIPAVAGMTEESNKAFIAGVTAQRRWFSEYLYPRHMWYVYGKRGVVSSIHGAKSKRHGSAHLSTHV